MNVYIENYKKDFEQAFTHLREEYRSLRTGRATPSLLDHVLIDAYGSKMPLKQLASITVSDARTLIISPWDKSVIKDIEKGITYSNLGLGCVSKGDMLLITLPMLTEDNRKELVKLALKKAEECRISGRSARDKVKEEVLKAEQDRKITEDDKYLYIKELDEYIADFNEQIKLLAQEKEKEIMTV
ncbi:MAG: ribosome recycling factor [Parcubacteria group bacterium]|nr:ribosome recycling factor [Parcubacteria group bacterium]